LWLKKIEQNIMPKRTLVLVPLLILTLSIYSQNSNPVFKCNNDTYKLLKEISSSVASKGEILLSITTHQDLGWVDEVEKCVIMRDTLWMTPYLKRLKGDPSFKMDIEQTSIIVEYLNRHPEKKAEIQKGLDDGRILVGATYTQPYEELFSGEALIRQLYIHGPSHHYAISASRDADILLPDAEKFAAINGLLEGTFRNYDVAAFDEAWEAKIYPDHGWGGKGGEMTDRLFFSKFVKARKDATTLLDGALYRIASKIDYKQTAVPVVVFNGLNWRRDDPVNHKCSFKMGEAFGVKIVDQDNMSIRSQLFDPQYYNDGSLRSAGISFIAENVPSTGYKTFYLETLKVSDKNQSAQFAPDFENRFFSIRFGKGGIEKLYDKTLRKEIIDASKFTLGEVFTMQSVGNGAGEFSDIQQPSMEGYDKTGYYDTKWEKVNDGPVFTSFRYRQPVKHAVVEETIIIYNQIKRIDFEIDIKNWEGILYREFRAAFPLNMTTPKITYEVPMGVVEVGKDELKGAAGHMYTTECKLVHPRTLLDWVNASDNSFGATLSSGVIAFDYLDPTPDPAQSTLIQPILMASRKSCHWEGNDYIQLGDHHFSFSLYIHEPGWKNGFRSGKQGQNRLYSVLDPVRGEPKSIPEQQSFLDVKGDLLMLSAFKKSEDDNCVTIRMTDMSGTEQNVQLEMFIPFQKLYRTSLIEEDAKDTGLSGNKFNLKIGKNSIETYKLILP
jgi:alpha-mannosidase